MKKVVVMGLWLAMAQLPVYADEIANVPPPPDLSSTEMPVDMNAAVPETAMEAEAYVATEVAPEATAPVETAVVAEEAVVVSRSTRW